MSCSAKEEDFNFCLCLFSGHWDGVLCLRTWVFDLRLVSFIWLGAQLLTCVSVPPGADGQVEGWHLN